LIGTQDWEYKLGVGAVKGFTLGTFTFRVAGEYDRSEDKFELGEYAVEYLKKSHRDGGFIAVFKVHRMRLKS